MEGFTWQGSDHIQGIQTSSVGIYDTNFTNRQNVSAKFDLNALKLPLIFVYKFNQNIDGSSNNFRVKKAVIRSNLVKAISANIADVKFYHNAIAMQSLDPILNKRLQESYQLIPFMCVK